MKYDLLKVVFIFLLIQLNRLSAQELTWAKQFAAHNLIATKLDTENNLINIGQFAGTVDFDPSAATNNLTSSGQGDIFISKMDLEGNLIWAKKVGGSVADRPSDVAIDQLGNIYVAGYFSGIADMNPGMANYPLTSAGDRDIFVLKLDANGNFVWAYGMGTSAWDEALGLAVDMNGDVYLGGFFGTSGGNFGVTMDLNPGSGVMNATTTGYAGDAFLIKLSTDGIFQWAKHFQGISNDEVSRIAITPENEILLCGKISSYFDFNESDFVDAADDELFLLKLQSDGTFIWLRTIDGDSNIYSPSVLKIDAIGHIHMAGVTHLPTNFSTIEATGFIINGSIQVSYIWESDEFGINVHADVFTTSFYITDITVDTFGSKYITGSFYLPNDFAFNEDDYVLTPVGNTYDILLAKYNTNNELQWAYNFGAVGSGLSALEESGCSIILTDNNTMYVTGRFKGQTDFDLLAGASQLNGSTGNSFITKYNVPIPVIENDLNGDGVVDMEDLLLLMENFGCFYCPEIDIDGDNIITVQDVMIMMGLIE